MFSCDFANNLYIIIAGATPLVTKSAIESSCFPNSPDTFSNLAANPSKKSKIMPNKINKDANANAPFNAKITAINPENRLSSVIKFGICFLIIICFNYLFSKSCLLLID